MQKRSTRRLGERVLLVCLLAASAIGQPAVVPIDNQPPAKLFIDPPLAGPLSFGRVVIPYRAQNLHFAPVFGPAAAAVSPRVGHVHLSVDGAKWVWVDAIGEPVVLNGFPPGRHEVRIQLQSANHQLLDEGAVSFTVPEPASSRAAAHAASAAVQPQEQQAAAKVSIGSPVAEALSRGVVILPYRAENLQIVPVYGPAAVAVSPRIGHIHVTVDDAQWHWADASGVPVILNGLAPGRHKILIELVNANHQRLDQQSVEVTVPAGKPHLEAE